MRPETAFLGGTQLKGAESQKIHFLSPDRSKTTSGTGPPLNFSSLLAAITSEKQPKPPVSVQKENALKITFLLGVAGRFLCSRGH